MSTQTLTQRHSSSAAASKPSVATKPHKAANAQSDTLGPVSSTSMPPMLWHRELTAVAFLGFLGSLYYLIPLALLLTPIGALAGYRWCWALLALYVVLAVLPEIPYRSFRSGYVMQCVLEYFHFRWVDAIEVREQWAKDGVDLHSPYDASRRFLATWMPHGIVPVGTLLGGSYLEARWPELYGKFAVAKSIYRLPVLRQVLGLFGIASAEYCDMRRGLQRYNMSVIPGGIAEMFLCDKSTERVYLQQRKGFCKLALTTGADVSLLYLYGATQTYDFLKPTAGSLISWLSRKAGVSLLLFYGRWGLPVPYRVPITLVCGQSIRVERCEQPSREQVEALHTRVMDDVRSLFYRHRAEAGPEWVSKELVIH